MGCKKGYKQTPEHTKKRFESRKRNGNKGYSFTQTPDFREKMSIARKGKCVGEKNWSWKGGGRKNMRIQYPLLYAIRECQKYKEWREAVLKLRVVSYPKIPKNIQVHHLTRVVDIIRKYHLVTYEEALNCVELWDVNNGVVITRGEHYIISMMERHKKTSPAFLQLIRNFVQTQESIAFEMGSLQGQIGLFDFT